MPQPSTRVLALNVGSSSFKFAVFETIEPVVRGLHGSVLRINADHTTLTVHDPVSGLDARSDLGALSHDAAADALVDFLQSQVELSDFAAIGHRLVHGGTSFREPERITADVVAELRRIEGYAPEHLPFEIALIEQLRGRFPAVPQVACFDTAFHRDLPMVARILPIPRRFFAVGIERYGFHGLSCGYALEVLAETSGAAAAGSRVIIAHLGNGSSVTAVQDGKSRDTSMSFSPAAGVPMSSRSGDIDPGVLWYLGRYAGLSGEQLHYMLNHESGLLGVSETTGDMRNLLALEGEDSRAAEAVALYCYQVKKWIGALAAALGGVDVLLFTGGIGENAPLIRARICEGLEFLGVVLAADRNTRGDAVISDEAASQVSVRIIRTDEELMIARSTLRVRNP